jgi:hypothetical protein
MPQPRQPFLHDLMLVLAAPTQALSTWSGEMGGPVVGQASAQGLLHNDVRVLSELRVRVDGQPAEHLHTDLVGSTATITSVLRQVGVAPTPDPHVRLDQVRTVEPGRCVRR